MEPPLFGLKLPRIPLFPLGSLYDILVDSSLGVILFNRFRYRPLSLLLLAQGAQCHSMATLIPVLK